MEQSLTSYPKCHKNFPTLGIFILYYVKHTVLIKLFEAKGELKIPYDAILLHNAAFI